MSKATITDVGPLPFTDLPTLEEVDAGVVWFDMTAVFAPAVCDICGSELLAVTIGDVCPHCDPDLLAMGLESWEIEPYGIAMLPPEVMAAMQQLGEVGHA